jgi:hypothetical protein
MREEKWFRQKTRGILTTNSLPSGFQRPGRTRAGCRRHSMAQRLLYDLQGRFAGQAGVGARRKGGKRPIKTPETEMFSKMAPMS